MAQVAQNITRPVLDRFFKCLVGGLVDGWMGVKAVLRIAYSNKKINVGGPWWPSGLERQSITARVRGSNPAADAAFFLSRSLLGQI